VDGSVLDRCIDGGDFDVVQVGYSLTHQGEADRIRKAHSRGIGVLIRSGLERGWLTPRALRVGREERPSKINALLDLCNGDAELLTSLALQFLARHEGVTSVLVGSKSPDNIRKGIESLMTHVDDALLHEAMRIGRTP
jgi:aryl-alcohol dehydrogenase-like predicted oxidoreductase